MRHKSGRYYARLYSGGQEKWVSLKTTLFEIAKASLGTDEAVAICTNGSSLLVIQKSRKSLSTSARISAGTVLSMLSNGSGPERLGFNGGITGGQIK
jgi:hypothetical protein